MMLSRSNGSSKGLPRGIPVAAGSNGLIFRRNEFSVLFIAIEFLGKVIQDVMV